MAEFAQKRASKPREEEPLPSKPKLDKKREETDKKTNVQTSGIKSTNLVQQEDEDDETPHFIDNDSFKPISNPLRNR
jgi:hypothetical protein